jgi:hypothetical protein
MSNFKDWTRDKLKKRFGLKRVYEHQALQEWNEECSAIEIDSYEQQTLDRLLQDLVRYVDYWNEDEVKLKFIGSIIMLTRFDTDELSGFSQREISGIVDGEELKGIPDFMVAHGKQEIDAPFFFLHEYKKELDNNSPDPAAQCLAAMLLAYEQNLAVPEMAGKPIRGTYVIGRQWFFVILQEKEYAISLAHDATHADEIIEILRYMKASKKKINEIWGQ